MKKTYTLLTIIFLISSNLAYPLSTFASSQSLNEGKKLQNIESIKEGKKLTLNDTLTPSDHSGTRFVVFLKKENYEKGKKKIMDNGGVISSNDSNTYGKVMAVPLDLEYMKASEKDSFLETTLSNSETVAIVPVEIRSISAIPSFNDPLYPTDLTYNSGKQWYLSQPSSGNYGIDIQRAWEYLDSQGVTYNGSSSVKVAVLDTGSAFENYSKYNQFTGANKMVNPLPWTFSKSTDFTSNLYVNSAETASNQVDDDANIGDWFCIDKNSNTQCDTGEPSSYIDDVNGVNIVDWGKYWSRVTYSELGNAPICTNEPYASDGVKCVSTYSNTSLCMQDDLPNSSYVGCFESDMGHPNDAQGHGTIVSNIISATPNNGISGVGISSGVSLMSIKIFGETYNTYRSKWVYDSAYGDQIANAVNYAVKMGANIINMSFAGSTVDYYEKMAIDNAYYNEDVLVVAASGNSGSSSASYPAGYDSVLSVGASTKTGGRVSYSNYGSTVDMVAPVDTGILTQGMWDTVHNWSITTSCSWDSSLSCMNVDPQSTPSPFSTFANLSVAGTSFSAPQVSAVAALLKSAYPNLSAKQLMYVLKMSGMPTGSLSNSTYIGSGILNAYNAVNAKDYRGVSLTEIKRMYQTMIGTTGYMYTRYSDNFGASWSGWVQSGSVKSAGGLITLRVPNSQEKVVQVIRSTNTGLYVRRSDDFGYIGTSDSTWSGWTIIGDVSGGVYAVYSGNNIVLSWKGNNGKLNTAYTSDGITWHSAPVSSQYASGGVQMITDIATQKVLQSIRSTSGYVYTRTSSDNGATWTGWVKGADQIISDPQLFAMDGKIFRVVKKSDKVIITRHSLDGGVTWIGRTRTYGTSGLTTGTIAMDEVSEKGTLVQTWMAIDKKIYSRYSTNGGATWSSQKIGYAFKYPLYPKSNPVSINAGGNVVQTVRASDSYMYYRISFDGGKTWGAWRNKGSIKITGNPYMWYESSMNRLYITARATDGYVNVRVSDNKGAGYISWYRSGKTNSGIRTDSTTMETLDYSGTPQ